MTERIEKTKAFLQESLAKSPYFERHPGKLSYRYEHSLRVAAIGVQIARADGLDAEALALGCLLHDISYSREFVTQEDWLNHGRESAALARPWLLGLGLPEALAEELCYGIAIHVDDQADFEGERTPLAELIGDCDNIDRYDSYRIYEILEGSGFSSMDAAGQLDWLAGRLPRMKEYTQIELTTPTATKLWEEKARFQLMFHERLYEQLMLPGQVL